MITPGFFVPIMWVDNPLSLAGGREIYGYNKNWGQIGVPKAVAQPMTLTSYGGDFGTGKKAGDFPLMDVHPSLATPFGRADDDPVWEDLESFLGVAERELFQSPLDPLVTNNATHAGLAARRRPPEAQPPDVLPEAVPRRSATASSRASSRSPTAARRSPTTSSGRGCPGRST